MTILAHYPRKHQLAILVVGFFMLALSTARVVVAGESAPSELLTKIVDKLKGGDGYAGMLDSVDWDVAFSRLDQLQKDQLKLTYPKQYREYLYQVYTQPEKLAAWQFDESLENLPAEQRAIMVKERDTIIAGAKTQQASEAARLARAHYQVGETSITNESATVQLAVSVDGAHWKQDVEFVRSHGDWALPNVFYIGDAQAVSDGRQRGGAKR